MTKALIGVNAAVYLLMLAQGASFSNPRARSYLRGAPDDPDPFADELIGLAEGEWWRLLTAAFLHAEIIHLAMNMFDPLVDRRVARGGDGPRRFMLLYVVSGLAGSAGAILLSPTALTVGASGAVFGLFGAGFVLERQAGIRGGPVMGAIVINLVFTFLIAATSRSAATSAVSSAARWPCSPSRASGAGTRSTGGSDCRHRRRRRRRRAQRRDRLLAGEPLLLALDAQGLPHRHPTAA